MKYYILLFLLPLHLLFSQEPEKKTGMIEGIVISADTREPLPGANVTVNESSFGASTDSAGRFSIRGVPIGTYTIKVSLLGYEKSAVSDIVVKAIKPVEITIPLRESSVELEGVSVTTEFFSKSADRTISTQSQSSEEIRRLPGGFEDVVRAISILPGVAQVQAGRNDLIVRGGAPSENLFLIDNLEVPNINHFGTQGASGGPLSYVNLDFVEGTTFSTGGFGVRYGDKLSSVLTITLREGRKDRLGGKVTLAATQFGGNLEGPLGSAGSFLFSARKSYLDLVFKAAGLSFVPEYWDYIGKATYHLNSRDQISFLGIFTLDRTRLFNDTPKQKRDNARIMSTDQNQGVGGISWQHLFSSGYITLTTGFRYNDYDYRQHYTDLTPYFISTTIDREESFLAHVVFQPTRSTEISAGGQIKTLRTNGVLSLDWFWTNYGQYLSINQSYDLSGAQIGAYLQFSKSVGIFKASAGIRADINTLLEQSSVFAPRFSLVTTLDPVTEINLSIGTYYQSPSLLWLATEPENNQLLFLGVQQYIFGIERLLQPDIKISLEGYLKQYFNYPVSLRRTYLTMANTGAGWVGSSDDFASFGFDRMSSEGSGLSHGVELFLQKKFAETPWYGTFSVSYNESEFRALDGVARPGSFDQRWIMNIGGGYVLNEQWEFSAKFRFATGRPYTPYNADGSQNVSAINSERVGFNHSLDIRADRRWSFSSWALITYVDIQNVYNRKLLDVPRYNEDIHQVEQPDAIGILPSIGISAEF